MLNRHGATRALIAFCLLIGLIIGTQAAPKTITREFKDADLVFVLKELSKEMGSDIYFGPNVQGKVTISLKNVTPEEAIKKVLALFGGKYDFRRLDPQTAIVALPGDMQRIARRHSTIVKEADEDAAPMPTLSATAPAKPVMVRSGAPVRGYMTRKRSATRQQFNTEGYDHIAETGFKVVGEAPLSTFSIDVDTASYANIRRFLMSGKKPPKDAVRIEEMLNYFRYDYKLPKNNQPFAVGTELATCPWNTEHQLLQIGLAAPQLDMSRAPARNLVFLLDVSGSMNSANKLPLLKGALKLLTKTLRPEDNVAIVVYAGASGVVLEPTSGENQTEILAALEKLSAGGSTNGGAGIQLAYKLAAENFKKGAVNRVILATDGDFNVGTTSRGDLIRLIEEKRQSGVFLSVLGFGSGNVKDSTMEQLADKGNGNYAYIDTLMEAKKVLVEEAGGTLQTVAKDVKLQLEFNPQKVHSYRLIGYENRRLENEDFDDDKKDAGEMGAGHTVTALYEIVPGKSPDSNLRYQGGSKPTDAARSGELALVKVRYKAPDADTSKLSQYVVKARSGQFARASEDLRFAASVASVGMLLRDSEFKGNSNFGEALSWAKSSLGEDEGGYRQEFIRLAELAQGLE